MNYRIKKVKRGDGIEITFDKLIPETQAVHAEMMLKTSRAEATKLINAMHNLKKSFLAIAEIEIEEENILSVTQVNFKQSKEKGFGVQMIAELYLLDSSEPLLLKSPTKWETGNDERELMSANLLTLLKEVQYEACDFIDQEKDMQLEIFNGNKEEAA